MLPYVLPANETGLHGATCPSAPSGNLAEEGRALH
eukprot:CAMPEP_0183362412 /NCGR_PEP_ID=MMETSP0164_2-20130417/69250_1 /TAXON_ID=221442 /ORGANISM="Coccolithus pelagicus ssp braarudi, Strain PLY182g" /LENGTH=34 /DNA_ID= /DNA_START= /DNA_END= /DNA_ORIENTATION=